MVIFSSNRSENHAQALYAAAINQARQEFLFKDFGVQDTIDGRFDMISLHIFLILRRLKEETDRTAELAQSLFDTMFGDMDRSLREMGAGDLGVGRRVKVMATAFYGRLAAYEKAMANNDTDALAKAILRNIFREEGSKKENAKRIANYTNWIADALSTFPINDLLEGHLIFPAMISLENF
ncbi:MAG: ubiquinol-cytochrome C chaperone [Rhodospirillaceae bacterium]|nr:ubiquinol-cytochrome C chaperone [Rhodospirillaceae bacterium]